MGGQDTHEGQRNRRHDNQRRLEALEPADHQHVDQHENRGKGQAQIAKYFDGDVPLPIPPHGVAVGTLRHGGALVLLHRVAVGQPDLVDRIAHFADCIDRALFLARNIARDINNRPQVLAIDAGVNCGLIQVGQFLKRDLTARRSRQLEVRKILDARPVCTRQAHSNRDILARVRIMQ